MKAVALARHLLSPRQNRLSALNMECHRLGLDALYRAVDDLPFLLDIVRVLSFALGLADALQDDLLGVLRSNAAKVSGSVLDHHHAPYFCIRSDGTRVRQ